MTWCEVCHVSEKTGLGVKPADNIAPCILGGITRSAFPLDIIHYFTFPIHLRLFIRRLEIKRSSARQNTPAKKYCWRNAIRQWEILLHCGKPVKVIMTWSSRFDVIIKTVRIILFQRWRLNLLSKEWQGTMVAYPAPALPNNFMLSKEFQQHISWAGYETVFEKMEWSLSYCNKQLRQLSHGVRVRVPGFKVQKFVGLTLNWTQNKWTLKTYVIPQHNISSKGLILERLPSKGRHRMSLYFPERMIPSVSGWVYLHNDKTAQGSQIAWQVNALRLVIQYLKMN